MAKRKYYLSPEKYFYNYALGASCLVYVVSEKGLYACAYSIKQACVYLKRRIAISQLCDSYDIDIDINDIKIMENFPNEEVPKN